MTYHSCENKACYFPPILSNGEISFAPDAQGMLGYHTKELKEHGMRGFDGIVVRVARRSAVCHKLNARLFPFGKFSFEEGSKLSEWSQTLRAEEGCFESDCSYEDGAKITSLGWIHPTLNLYALQKEFHLVGEHHKKVSYEISLCGYNEEISRYMKVLYVKRSERAAIIGFQMYGMEVFEGEIRCFVDKEFTISPGENAVRITFDVSDGEKVTFYYYLEDNLFNVDFLSVLQKIEQKIDEAGFDQLHRDCVEHFQNFFSVGSVKTSDETLNKIYRTSLYSIKSNTTKYSTAVGLNNGAWDGRYFAFDEYSSYFGLLGAGQFELAKRIPTYRLRQCLPSAIQRASDLHRTADTEDMALFHWESGELGDLDLSPYGHWRDHVFHMPLVGIGAFQYYEYTEDVDFLRECYPMIRACAKFFTKHMVYADGERLYLGKCTDLERLGSSVENPFMTACGAIKLLECTKKAADILSVDAEYAKECADVAEKLRQSLPTEHEQYVPHLGCKQKSIAVFAGKFPFDVLKKDDEKMLRAWQDFENNGASFGNMYPVGQGISSWYACWKAIAYAKAQKKDEAYAAIRQAYSSAGVFGELFEINEENYQKRPWFSTAAGTFVATVNEMLLQRNGQTITILPGLPHTVDASFQLATTGGLTINAEVKNETLTKIAILKNGVNVTEQFNVIF